MLIRKEFIFLILLSLIFPLILKAYAESNSVLVVKVNGEITKATEVMLADAINFAHSYNARLIVVELNTPGGELDSVQSIMEMFDTSEIPDTLFFVYHLSSTSCSNPIPTILAKLSSTSINKLLFSFSKLIPNNSRSSNTIRSYFSSKRDPCS